MARWKEESLIHRSPTLRIIGDHKLTRACASNHWRSKINIGIPTLRIIGDHKLTSEYRLCVSLAIKNSCMCIKSQYRIQFLNSVSRQEQSPGYASGDISNCIRL
eukprot:596869_1